MLMVAEMEEILKQAENFIAASFDAEYTNEKVRDMLPALRRQCLRGSDLETRQVSVVHAYLTRKKGMQDSHYRTAVEAVRKSNPYDGKDFKVVQKLIQDYLDELLEPEDELDSSLIEWRKQFEE
jgi:MFS superfamily sulfate permease-like transporter